jgi:hypothetical protein
MISLRMIPPDHLPGFPGIALLSFSRLFLLPDRTSPSASFGRQPINFSHSSLKHTGTALMRSQPGTLS